MKKVPAQNQVVTKPKTSWTHLSSDVQIQVVRHADLDATCLLQLHRHTQHQKPRGALKKPDALEFDAFYQYEVGIE